MKKPWIGVIAFLLVLMTMPLGHAAMILMEKGLGDGYLFKAAAFLGAVGVVMMLAGIRIRRELPATLLGFFGGLFTWTGWVEFAFVYYARRYGVEPLMANGEIVTKPEYLLMPASVGFLATVLLLYLFRIKSACNFFLWFQHHLRLERMVALPQLPRSTALATFLETVTVLWFFFLTLLFVYDDTLAGDRHPLTYLVAFGSLLWSLYLMIQLLKMTAFGYAIRYAIPTVIIFWNVVEILGRWGTLSEIWVTPEKHWLEMLLMLVVLALLIPLVLMGKKRSSRLP